MKLHQLSIATLLCVACAYATPKMGTIKDSRDGQTYKTVRVGSQIWMAENLNIKTDDS